MTDAEADAAQNWRGMDGAQAAPPAPATPAEIAACLRDLSRRMLACGTAMDYYGGMGPMAKHGLELIGAARIASDWADEIEKEATDA